MLNQTLLAIAICTGIAFVFEELALHLQGIENVQAQYMVQFSLNVFILGRRSGYDVHRVPSYCVHRGNVRAQAGEG